MASTSPDIRVCRSCNESKPLTTEFWHAGALYLGGFRPRCKVCVNKRLTAYKASQRRERGAKPRRRPRVVGGIEQWECSTPQCGWHSRSDFYTNENGTPRSYCRSCHNKRVNGRLEDPDVREQINEQTRQRAKSRDSQGWAERQSKRQRREELAALGLKHCPGPCDRDLPFEEFQPTPERTRGIRSKCRECRNEQNVVYRKAGWERDPERYRGHIHARHARVRGAPVSDLTVEEWRAIRAAYDDCCAFCGRHCTVGGQSRPDKLTKEHAIPVSRGGWHSASNVFPACCSCNARKKDRTAEEFAVTGRVLDVSKHPFYVPHTGPILSRPSRKRAAT